MASDGKIRVLLDTSQAEKELDRLGASGEAAAARVQKSLNEGSSGVGVGRVAALGAAFGFGAAAAQKAASGTLGAVFSEGTVGLRALADDVFGGPELRGNKSARELTKERFGLVVGQTRDASAARGYYDSMRKIEQQRAQGQNLIDQEIGGIAFGAKTPDDAVDLIVGAISRGFQDLRDAWGRWTSR